jgi:hypothetical protein
MHKINLQPKTLEFEAFLLLHADNSSPFAKKKKKKKILSLNREREML